MNHLASTPDSVMAPETTILKTIHGSHLYGLARENSGLDTYEVFIGGDKRRAEQRLDGQDDIVRIHLDRFLDQVNKGVSQALEAWIQIVKATPCCSTSIGVR